MPVLDDRLSVTGCKSVHIMDVCRTRECNHFPLIILFQFPAVFSCRNFMNYSSLLCIQDPSKSIPLPSICAAFLQNHILVLTVSFGSRLCRLAPLHRLSIPVFRFISDYQFCVVPCSSCTGISYLTIISMFFLILYICAIFPPIHSSSD